MVFRLFIIPIIYRISTFLGKSDYLVFLNSTEAKYTFLDDIISEEGMDLISKLILIKPNDRLKMEDIYSHNFISSYIKNDTSKYPIFSLSEIAYMQGVRRIRDKF